MGRGLHATQPVFRAELDRCLELLRPLLGHDLRPLLFPASGEEQAAVWRLDQTALAQPAVFAVEYALARLWQAWGVPPRAMLGHSLGELVAACIAGVMDLPDALRLVVERGRIVQALPEGAMLTVASTEAEVRRTLPAGLSLAAVNAHDACVVAGPVEAVVEHGRALAERGIDARRLPVTRAFHSSMMDDAMAPLRDAFASVPLRAPAIPYVSSLTGQWIEPAEATDPDYWARHLRHPVRFADGLACLLADEHLALLEVGPGRALTHLATRQAALSPSDGQGHRVVAASMRHRASSTPDRVALLEALARLWLDGVDVSWNGVHAGRRRRTVALSPYPFERRRHWVEPRVPSTAGAAVARPSGASAAKGRREDAPGTEAPDAEAAAPKATPAPPATADLSGGLSTRLSGGFSGGLAASTSGSAVGRPPMASAHVAPRTPIEEQLTGMWQALLGFDGLGVEDDFFELGGQSLLAVRLVDRIRETFEVEFPLGALFDRPTVAQMAQEVEALLVARVEALSETEVQEALHAPDHDGAAGRGARPQQ